MGTLTHIYTWFRRIGRASGYGIQSPTDYRFVRDVIGETWPYHAYDSLPEADRLTDRLGRLYLRIANERQPRVIVDLVGMGDYLHAGCRKAQIVTDTDAPIEMAVVPIECQYKALFSQCNEQSLVVFHNIHHAYPLWRSIENDPQAVVTFDLYYCGIVVFDTRRSRHNYKLNF